MVYLYSYSKYGEFLVAIGELKPTDSIFQVKGYFITAIKVIFLFISPLFFLRDAKISNKELYFTGDNEYIYFEREINHYLYIIQFTVQFWFFIYILL